MKTRLAILAAPLLLAAVPAHAEKLLFDHPIVPEVGAVLDSGRKEMVHFDDSNPSYVYDRIAIQGRSADDWTEALEIIVRKPGRQVKTTAEWMRQIGTRTAPACAVQLTPLASDETSQTFARQTQACGGAPAEIGLYRIVAGRKSLFLLAARQRGAMSEARRRQWLTMLASARVEN